MELIAGDIGGTKSWLVWVTIPEGDVTGRAARVRHEQIYPSASFASGEALLRQFVADSGVKGRPDRAMLAVPGPLHVQRVQLTNLDWTLDAEALQHALDLDEVGFINDFEAAAAGVATLLADDVLSLNDVPADPRGVRAITGAGTGLGVAFMVPDAHGRYRQYASEGGHIDFAPADARQVRLLEHLRARYGHVSWERAVSGSALPELYRFCCQEAGATAPRDPVEGAELVARADAGEARASSALELFIDLYGAWIGNVALLFQPHGGLYIAGGVARHLVRRMTSARLIDAARDKGRMRKVVERTPIKLVTTARLGVQGAIARGAQAAVPRGHRPTLQTA